MIQGKKRIATAGLQFALADDAPSASFESLVLCGWQVFSDQLRVARAGIRFDDNIRSGDAGYRAKSLAQRTFAVVGAEAVAPTGDGGEWTLCWHAGGHRRKQNATAFLDGDGNGDGLAFGVFKGLHLIKNRGIY